MNLKLLCLLTDLGALNEFLSTLWIFNCGQGRVFVPGYFDTAVLADDTNWNSYLND